MTMLADHCSTGKKLKLMCLISLSKAKQCLQGLKPISAMLRLPTAFTCVCHVQCLESCVKYDVKRSNGYKDV